MRQVHEAVVFINGEAKLRYKAVQPESVRLLLKRDGKIFEYKESSDFTVDYENGVLFAHSQGLHDYTQSGFYGVDHFSHEGLETFGNGEYTYYADYDSAEEGQCTDCQIAIALTQDTQKIIRIERDFRYVVFGDSISVGLEVSAPEYVYHERFSRTFARRWGVKVQKTCAAVGGETSADGLKRLDEDILPLQPDLITIAYGMNDQNRACGEKLHFVEPNQYKENIRAMILPLLRIGCQIILVSPCQPNPRWNWTSGDTILYSEALRELSREYSLPFADVTALWQQVLDTGKPCESLLLNDINHPNDYGHFLYACALEALVD